MVMAFHLFYSNVEKIHAVKCSEGEDYTTVVLVKDEPPEPEFIDSEQTLCIEEASDRKELIVGDVAFEIVQVDVKQDIEEIKQEVEPEDESWESPEAELLETDNNNELDDSSETESFSCRKCKKTFEEKVLLQLHRRIVHGNQTVDRTCSKCDLVGQALKDILEQDQAETSEHSRRMQCSVCDVWLLNTSSLQRHVLWHWTEKCGNCKKTPQHSEEKEPEQTKPKLHLKKVHPTVPRSRCKCHNLEQALEDIAEQNQTESGRIKCTVCDGWLMNVASLQRHLVWHQSEPCDICGKRPQLMEAAVKQHVQVQKVSTPKRLSTAVPQPKKPKMDESVTMQHVCPYCGLYFDVFDGLVKHQLDEHPGKKHRTYTSYGTSKK